MAYRVILSQAARDSLEALAQQDRPAGRELALVLLSLGQNPEPLGSRDLSPTLVNPQKGERIWDRPPWIITYRMTAAEKLIEVAAIDTL